MRLATTAAMGQSAAKTPKDHDEHERGEHDADPFAP